MAEVSREEINAKLEAVEARIETRLVGIDSKIDRLGEQVIAATKQLSLEVGSAKEASRHAQSAAEKAEQRAEEARRAASSTKWNIAFAAIAVIGVLLTLWALWGQAIEIARPS